MLAVIKDRDLKSHEVSKESQSFLVNSIILMTLLFFIDNTSSNIGREAILPTWKFKVGFKIARYLVESLEHKNPVILKIWLFLGNTEEPPTSKINPLGEYLTPK